MPVNREVLICQNKSENAWIKKDKKKKAKRN